MKIIDIFYNKIIKLLNTKLEYDYKKNKKIIVYLNSKLQSAHEENR